LAKHIGVTPSTISQIESNLIYPSLPGLLKIAEVLSVPASSFLEEEAEVQRRFVFPSYEAKEIKIGDRPEGSIMAKALVPDAAEGIEPYLIEISPKEKLPSHFFVHKGEEIGYLISGRLRLDVGKTVHNLRAGDFVHLTSETPTQWKNPGPGVARLLWIKLK
jgi:transcriptional regulator with XRE-family HTH domain